MTNFTHIILAQLVHTNCIYNLSLFEISDTSCLANVFRSPRKRDGAVYF